ncbi:MAG TPA: lantibiotic dehydratase [Pyrinomonadaceae bacterium]|nr:lantibiotic dehydratase [Pyrinomonadaceae bacterium]
MNFDDRSLQPSLTTEAPSNGAARAGAGAAADSHLIALPGGEWRVWRWVGLRGAGFPAVQVRALSAEGCARAADELIWAEDEVEKKQEQALDAIRTRLDSLRAAGQWSETDRRSPLVKAMRAMSQGKVPPGGMPEAVAAEVDAYRAACARREAAAAAYLERYGEDVVGLSRTLQEVAMSSRFREAVIWQNRHAFHTALVPFLKQSPQTGRSSIKGYKELIANYLQRYCVKNDTIGFFGPVGWARFVPQGEALTARPGPGLVATRNVYFENWCMDALAEKLNADESLRPWFTPRRVPYLHVKGTTLYLPHARPVTLPRPAAVAIQLSDGQKTAKEIAGLLARMCPAEVAGEAEAYELLEQLSAKGLVLWRLEIAPGTYPDRILRRSLERIGDEGLRASVLAGLDELEVRRAAVSRAAGDAEQLDRALGELDESFSRISGVTETTRAAGEMYAARTLVYEDCRRDMEVELGPDVLRRLGPPLSLLLMSARWFTYQMAEFYRGVFARVFEEVARQKGSREVDCATFWYHAQPHVMNKDRNAGNAVLPEFQRRWAEIFALPEGRRHVEYTVEQLRPLVRERFDAPGPGWSSACYHSPDVMIAAADAEAVRRGEYQLVLGECHLGSNTLSGSLFVAQHPRPEDLYRSVEYDWPETSVRIVSPKSWPSLTARTTPVLMPRSMRRVLVTHDSIPSPEMKHLLEVGSLVVREEGGRLVVQSRDGGLTYDILEAFSDTFYGQLVSKFKLRGAAGHTPRVSVGGLVVMRESWVYEPEEFPFAFGTDAAARFLAARRWAFERGMPRFVFAKSPVEKKPIYVDFASPIYVDILAKVIRRTAKSGQGDRLIAVSEMLPPHGQLWLSDAEGQRYTSELRIIAFQP